MVPALALLGPWLALALIAAFRDGGSSDTGLTIAAVGAILACALALLLAAIGRLELPRPTGAGLVALAGLGVWCAVALASISWSLSPADSWQDGIHVACAAAALAGGMWIGALLRRPAQAACLVLAAIAVTVAVYAIAQRSFSSEFIAASFPRLREPFGYSNALAALFVSGVPATLVLGSRRSVVARAGGAACVAVLTVALILTGSRGGLLAALLAIAVLLVLGGRRLELVTTLACGVVPAAPVALYGVRLPTFSSADPPPSAGAGLLIGLIAAACIAAVAGALAQRIVDGLAAQTRVRTRAPSARPLQPSCWQASCSRQCGREARSPSSTGRGTSSRGTVRSRTRPATASSRCRRTSATAGGARPGTRSRCGRSRASGQGRST